MAYVAPNSKLQLFKGINLDNRYMHTIYFASESTQNNWFSNKASQANITAGNAFEFTNLMYRRHGSNAVKIEINAMALLGVSYLRFQNTRVLNSTSKTKWFYAFVTQIDYVNENTSIVYYEIDVMQTWFFQGGSIRPCMVLREHSSTDVFGENLEEEPIGSEVYDCDELTYTDPQDDPLNLFHDYSLVFNTSENPITEGGDIINNGLVNGTMMRVIPVSNQSQISQNLTDLVDVMNGSWESGQRPIEVIDMFTFPTKFCDTNPTRNTYSIKITHPANLDGYVPKNKKLFGYPFSFLQLTTKNGNGCALKWEYFAGMLETSNSANFIAYGSPIAGGQVICYPDDYNGVDENIDCGLTIDNFPKNPFSYDSYQAWLASGGKIRLENESQITNVRGFTALYSSISNFFSGGLTGISQFGSSAMALGGTDTAVMSDLSGMARGSSRAVQGIAGVTNTIMDVTEAKNKINYSWNDSRYKPNTIVGFATPSLAIGKDYLDFYFLSVHVRKDELIRLDDFLTCFGYATNKVKAPNLTGRTYWNFVQTQNAVIAGDMPSSSKEAIGRIFDGGITFWHSGDNVGNYMVGTSSSDVSINNPIS